MGGLVSILAKAGGNNRGNIVASKRFHDDANPNTPCEWENKYFFYNYDMRGSTTAIIKPDGNSVTQYAYDEFGNLSQTGTTSFKNEVTFTSSISDTSTGLQYMNSRYYDSSTGRFISQDTYTGNPYDPWTQNLYSYCGGNPTNFIDPTGHAAEPNQDAYWVGGLNRIFVDYAGYYRIVKSDGRNVRLVDGGDFGDQYSYFDERTGNTQKTKENYTIMAADEMDRQKLEEGKQTEVRLYKVETKWEDYVSFSSNGKGKGLNARNVNPMILWRLAAFAKEQGRGEKIEIGWGYRTTSDQRSLSGGKLAASVGNSWHQTGLAIDVTGGFANRGSNIYPDSSLLQYGLIRNVWVDETWESWHYNMLETTQYDSALSKRSWSIKYMYYPGIEWGIDK